MQIHYINTTKTTTTTTTNDALILFFKFNHSLLIAINEIKYNKNKIDDYLNLIDCIYLRSSDYFIYLLYQQKHQ
jgi:hypothetical protein